MRPPARRGHFLLESGLHTDSWLNLEAAFRDPATLDPGLDRMAELLRPYGASAVCGPLAGGALVAQRLAARLGIHFYFSERIPPAEPGLFTARYRIPEALRITAAQERFIVVDDAISAGSSVRATIADIEALGAALLAVGAIWLIGDRGERHFLERDIPVAFIAREPLQSWEPRECPLCREGAPLIGAGSAY